MPGNTAMSDLLPLTQEQRQDAQQASRDAVLRDIGDRPRREHFQDHTASEFSPGVTRFFAWLCGVLLLAAFTPSAIRLYTIGSETFSKTIDSTEAALLVGIATVLSAETGQVVFSLALATCRFQRNIGMEYGENCQNQPLRDRKIPA